MDDLFNFSFSEFGGVDTSSGFDSIFSALGAQFGDSAPSIAQEVAKFALKQAMSGGSSQATPQQLFNSFVKQAFGGQSTFGQSDSYFQLSSGQSMAQIASLIFRAQRRFL